MGFRFGLFPKQAASPDDFWSYRVPQLRDVSCMGSRFGLFPKQDASPDDQVMQRIGGIEGAQNVPAKIRT